MSEAKKPLTVQEFLEIRMNDKLKADPDRMEGYNCIYQFEIDDKTWNLDLTASPPQQIKPGTHPTPDCTIKMSEESFQKMIRGKLNVPMALITGKVKIGGSKALALKLSELFS